MNAAYISRGTERWPSDFRERPTSSHLHCCLTVKSATLWWCFYTDPGPFAFSRWPKSRSWPEDIQRGRSAIIIAISGSPQGESAAAILDASGGGGRGAASGSILEDLYIAGALGSELSRTPASTALTPQLQHYTPALTWTAFPTGKFRTRLPCSPAASLTNLHSRPDLDGLPYVGSSELVIKGRRGDGLPYVGSSELGFCVVQLLIHTLDSLFLGAEHVILQRPNQNLFEDGPIHLQHFLGLSD